jgi:hypothetical protein
MKKTLLLSPLLLFIIFITSCGITQNKEKLAKTKIKFKDSIRHYFAIPQGK